MVSARGRLHEVAYARKRGLSQTKACVLFHVARSMTTYESKLDAKDAPVIDRMAAVAQAHPRYGYRRVRVLLGREGKPMSPRRAHRLWRKAGLQVPKKKRRRVPTRTVRPTPAAGANHVWCYDFVFDMCANGQPLKCLTVVDEYTRECLAIDVARGIRSERVIEVLGRLVAAHGAPAFLRSDNGPEFVAQAVQDWLKEEGIQTAYSAPGKPWQNGLNESFNGKLRDECLDMEWFPTRREAVIVIEGFRKHYNDVRPHSSLGYRTPHEFKTLLQSNQPVAALTQ
jgi:putative transposase